MEIHLDISQLVADPRRSGIQRAERELIRHWPGPATLVPCCFDAASGAMQELPAEIFDVLCDDAPTGGVTEDLLRLQPFLRPVRVAAPTRILNAELFADVGRAGYYRRRASDVRAYWIVYDFLPWLHPDWFSLGSAARLMPYLDALDCISDLAFISPRTREDCWTRILRRPAQGPVIPMGGDGLGLERQLFDPDRHDFVMLGTIEPRKTVLPVIRAFERLWSEGVQARLVMIGSVSPDATAEIEAMRALEGQALFERVEGASDEAIRAILRTARALVFPSEGEGYGIPPMEALHAGIPVIVSAGLPALDGQPSGGQIRLRTTTPDDVAGAVRLLLDNEGARALWAGAGKMQVSTWADFSHRTAAWVQS